MLIDKDLQINIVKSKRRKTIALEVYSSKDVLLRVPEFISDSYIYDFINSKLDWIKKQQKKFVNLDNNFQSLEESEYLYLGKKFKVKYLRKDLLEKWYRKQAQIIFTEYLLKYSKTMGLKFNKLRIMKARTRWGSCNYNKGYINLNLNLIKLDRDLIKYVVIHELAHLKHPNHSREFWNLVAEYCPKYQKHIQELKKYSLILRV